MKANLWGYNGNAPGPTIQVTRGDRVRIIVDNHLPEATSMHWHGFDIPNDMDGAPGSSQDPIAPGGRFVYEFSLNQEGTYFYHSHMAMQEMMGMIGAFVMHPKEAYKPRVDKDFAIIMQEYAILPNIKVPNSMNMEFNWLTFNGKSGPANTPLIVRHGERVRLRFINLGMDHHPIHLHGHQFVVTGTEGGRQTARVDVGTGKHGARRCGAITRRRVCRKQSRRLDAALPSPSPHDEPDVFQCRSDDTAKWNPRGSRHGARHGDAAARKRHV